MAIATIIANNPSIGVRNRAFPAAPGAYMNHNAVKPQITSTDHWRRMITIIIPNARLAYSIRS
jgi:hypothetical protein